MDGGSWHAPWKEKTGIHLRPWGVFWGHGGFSGFCVVNNTENPGKRTPKDLTFAELMLYNSFTFRNIVSHTELMYLAWCRPLRRTWKVSQVTAKQDDRIKRHFDFLFFPCIFIALENLSGDGVWMLGVCTARRMLLSIKAPVGKSKCRNEKDYDRSRIEKIEPRRAAGAAFGREQGERTAAGSAARNE